MPPEEETTVVSEATTGTEPLGNAEGTRNPDGTIKDPAATAETTTQTSEQQQQKPPVSKESTTSEGAPEKYEPFKVPEGYELDEEAVKEVSTIFKDLNLSQEQAQRLVDFYNETTLEAEKAPYEAYDNLRNEWRDAVIKDTTIGNGSDGLKPEVSASIGRAIDSLGPELSKEFRDAMTLTGAGDNPAFVKAFYNLAQQLGEGTLVTGRTPSPAGQARPGSQPRSAAAAIYPNLPSSR